MARILVVDDDKFILDLLRVLLTRDKSYEVVIARGGESARDILQTNTFDLMISDIRMAPVDGMELLKLARAAFPDMAVIMMTAYGSVETAVQAMNDGVFDYVTKPIKVDELLITVKRALEYYSALAENVHLKAQLEAASPFENIVANSAGMRHVCEMIQRLAPTDATLLICGEHGSGRSLVARTLHEHSRRKAKPFVVVDCDVTARDLLETAIFGQGRGGMDGDSSTRPGAVDQAKGGALLLNEIDALPRECQTQLLQLLQEGRLHRQDGAQALTADVRVLATTTQSLGALVAAGRFREELWNRLRSVTVELPPLRDRREDILSLAYLFLQGELGAGQDVPGITPEAQSALEAYAWPDNVHELAGVMRQLVSGPHVARITRDVLPAKIQAAAAAKGSGPRTHGRRGGEAQGKSLRAFLRAQELKYLRQAVHAANGDEALAAKSLGITLTVLQRKLQDVGP